MKKVIPLILVLAICLSLCACKENSSNNNEDMLIDMLTAEPWKDIMTEGAATLVLFEDGTGNFSADNDVAIGFSYSITWELEDDHVFVKSPQAQFPLYITEEDGKIKLKIESEKNIYVPLSQYDEIRKDTKLPTDELLIEIVNNDGEMESYTVKELIEIKNNNGAKFEKKYFGAKVTVVSSVKSIHGATILNGHSMDAYIELNGGWVVEAESADEVIDLNPGDLVKITGNIYDAFAGNVSIYIVNGHSTSIELYSE